MNTECGMLNEEVLLNAECGTIAFFKNQRNQ